MLLQDQGHDDWLPIWLGVTFFLNPYAGRISRALQGRARGREGEKEGGAPLPKHASSRV